MKLIKRGNRRGGGQYFARVTGRSRLTSARSFTFSQLAESAGSVRWVLSARPGAQAWGRRAELGGLGSPNRSAPDRAADRPLTRSSAPEAVPQLGGGRASLPLGIRTPSSPPPSPGDDQRSCHFEPWTLCFPSGEDVSGLSVGESRNRSGTAGSSRW